MLSAPLSFVCICHDMSLGITSVMFMVCIQFFTMCLFMALEYCFWGEVI